MNMPTVQVIVPLYNNERDVEECLRSLRNQQFTNWQALVIDDCSRDGSVDIVRRYVQEDPRITLTVKEKNGGVSHTRNMGLEMLTAEYVAFLDADDYWEPEMLSSLVEAARRENCDVVQSRFIYDFPGGRQVLPKGAFSRDVVLEGRGLRKVYRRMMTGINMNHVCMKLIRTELIRDLRFDVTMRTAEDLKMCIAVFKKVKKYCFLNRAMYHYRRSEASITGKGLPAKEKLRANQAISQDLLLALPEWGIDNLFYRTLARMRPYVIAANKAFRILREKLMSR